MNKDRTENSLLNTRNKDFVSNNDTTIIIDKLISVILDNGGKLFGGFVRDYIVPEFIKKSKEILRESSIPIYRDFINIVSSYLYCVDDTRDLNLKHVPLRKIPDPVRAGAEVSERVATLRKIPNLFFNDIDVIVPNKETMNNIIKGIWELDFGKIKYIIKRSEIEIVEGKDNNQFGYFFNKNNHILKIYDKKGNDFTCFIDFITIDRDVYIPHIGTYGISENLGYEIEEKIGDEKEQKVSDRTKIFPVWDFSINLLSYSKVSARPDNYELKAEKGLNIKTKKGKYSDEFYVYSIRNEEFTLDDILDHILDKKLIPLNINEIEHPFYESRTRKFYKRKYQFEDDRSHK